MSEDHSPFIREDKTHRIQQIIEEHDAPFTPKKPTLSPGEAKRIELIRKMKEDTDKKEYVIMFNALMITFSVVSLYHFIRFGTILSLVCILLGLGYFIFIRKRLTAETLKLTEYKNQFDKYLWEGFHLKEMRYTAVKLAYILFFPMMMVFISDIITGSNQQFSFWIALGVAVVISTIGWLIFFADDQSALKNIETDLKSLEYL